MGQYYKVINFTKKQTIYPHAFNDGLKLCEFGCSGEGTMFALALLLAKGNGGGGGDLHIDDSKQHLIDIIGSWAGDNIMIAGDYYENDDGSSPYVLAKEFEDISHKVLACMLQDEWFAKRLNDEKAKEGYQFEPFIEALAKAKKFDVCGDSSVAPVKKARGRPKGSKNKTKIPVPDTVTPTEKNAVDQSIYVAKLIEENV